MLRIYSFGVTPVLFLNDRKKEARELKPQRSRGLGDVYKRQPVLFLNDRKKEARELKPQSSANAVNV